MSTRPRSIHPVRKILNRVIQPTTVVAVIGATLSLLVSYLVSQISGK